MSYFKNVVEFLRRRPYSIASRKTSADVSKAGEHDKPTALILDLGGVFCTFSDVPDAPIPPQQFRILLDSAEWHNLESGKKQLEEVCVALTKKFSLAEGALEESLRLVSTTLAVNKDFVAAIKKLKDESNGQLRVFAASNISQERYAVLREKLSSGWEIFDDVFISAQLGVRKPERAFYDRVLEATGITAESAVFVDNRHENVISAQCCGMHGVVFTDTESIIQKLNNLFGDPLQRGKAWLQAHAKNRWCVSSTGVEIQEQYQQLLLLNLTKDRNLVQIGQANPHTGYWNVFAYGPPVLTTNTYPDDLDTTALALLTLDISKDEKHKIMDDMLQYINPDGLAYTYFDLDRPRIDHFISANLLRLFYANSRGSQLASALRFMEDMLRSGAYEHGTRYYHLADFLLFYLSDLCAKNQKAVELQTLDPLVRQRLQERMGCTTDAPSAALRLIASNNMNMSNSRDRKILLDQQQLDGRWTGYVYCYGASRILFGSDGLTTAFAVAALQGIQ